MAESVKAGQGDEQKGRKQKPERGMMSKEGTKEQNEDEAQKKRATRQ